MHTSLTLAHHQCQHSNQLVNSKPTKYLTDCITFSLVEVGVSRIIQYYEHQYILLYSQNNSSNNNLNLLSNLAVQSKHFTVYFHSIFQTNVWHSTGRSPEDGTGPLDCGVGPRESFSLGPVPEYYFITII